MNRRIRGPLPHLHTSGSFQLLLHIGHLGDSCVMVSNGTAAGGAAERPTTLFPAFADAVVPADGCRLQLTQDFVDELVTEVRAVVGSAVFAIASQDAALLAAPQQQRMDGSVENRLLLVPAIELPPAHHASRDWSAAGASKPPPSRTLAAVLSQATRRAPNAMGGPSPQSQVPFTLRVKDSRISAALAEAIRRHSFVALERCRLQLDATTLAAGGGAGAEDDAATGTPDRLNMDAELFQATKTAAQSALTFIVGSDSNMLAPPAVAPLDVATLLEDYGEFIKSVTYAAVYTKPGSGVASPFAVLLFALWYLRANGDELRFMATHQNRYLRAAAMYYARYTMPPETLAPCFEPSIDDETVIGCAGDFSVTRPIKDLAKLLWETDDVDEAWLPSYRKWWKVNILQPLWTRMLEHRASAMRAAVHLQEKTTPMQSGLAAATAAALGKGVGSAADRGGGTTALFGFRSAAEFAMFVDRARVLASGERLNRLLQEMGGNSEDDDEVGVDDDEEAAHQRNHDAAKGTSTHRAPASGGGGASAAATAGEAEQMSSETQDKSGAAPPSQQQQQRGRKRQRDAVVAVPDATRRFAMTHGRRAIAELLGDLSATCMSKTDPVYLDF